MIRPDIHLIWASVKHWADAALFLVFNLVFGRKLGFDQSIPDDNADQILAPFLQSLRADVLDMSDTLDSFIFAVLLKIRRRLTIKLIIATTGATICALALIAGVLFFHVLWVTIAISVASMFGLIDCFITALILSGKIQTVNEAMRATRRK
jgi:hypothetical protein